MMSIKKAVYTNLIVEPMFIKVFTGYNYNSDLTCVNYGKMTEIATPHLANTRCNMIDKGFSY